MVSALLARTASSIRSRKDPMRFFTVNFTDQSDLKEA